jgi:hypothetical protein
VSLSFLAAVLACAVLLLAAIAAHLWIISRRDLRRRLGEPYRPRHGRAAPGDPADGTDPDGEQYVRQLRGDDDEGFWDEPAPGGRIEILTGPGAPIPQTSETVTGVLERQRQHMPRREPGAQMAAAPLLRTAPADAGLLGEPLAAMIAWQPGRDGEHTGPLAILGRPGQTPAELAARLAAKHLTAPPEMTP